MTTVRHLLDRKDRALFSIEPEDPVLEAIRMMADRHVGALLVMRGSELAGIVSERDYARKVVLLGRSSAETPVWQIMSSPVVTVSLDSSIEDCMRLMTERRIRHLPVVDGKELKGVVSLRDVLMHQSAELQRETRRAAS